MNGPPALTQLLRSGPEAVTVEGWRPAGAPLGWCKHSLPLAAGRSPEGG